MKEEELDQITNTVSYSDIELNCDDMNDFK